MKYVDKVTAFDYHRNGVGGEGFYVLTFKSDNRDMMGVVFPDPGYVAVFDVALLAQGNIKFFENSWRGDKFEPELRQHIHNHMMQEYGHDDFNPERYR